MGSDLFLISTSAERELWGQFEEFSQNFRFVFNASMLQELSRLGISFIF